MTQVPPSSILALDVGGVRIGVARAGTIARLAEPLTTLPNTPDVYGAIAALCAEYDAHTVVVGWPRGLEGQRTEQTQFTEDFVRELQQHLDGTIVMQDEALTSQKAEADLARHGKAFRKDDVDALAATYILEDYLQQHGEGSNREL